MNSREIRRRIASVKETVKITKAMYSISVAKTMKGKRILPDAKRFFDENRRVFSEIACLSGASYFRARGERAAFVVIGGEKGLCGGIVSLRGTHLRNPGRGLRAVADSDALTLTMNLVDERNCFGRKSDISSRWGLSFASF